MVSTTLIPTAAERPITRFESVTSMLLALGIEAKTLVLSVVEDKPTDAEQEALDLGPDDSVIRLERLRSRDDDPLVYMVATIPRERIPGPVKHVNWAGSLNDLLAAQGHLMVSSAARIQAVDLPQEARDRYQHSGFGPWLLITETAVTPAGTTSCTRRTTTGTAFSRSTCCAAEGTGPRAGSTNTKLASKVLVLAILRRRHGGPLGPSVDQ